jgi:hypothetical protein
MASLISLEAAKADLRIDDSDHDADVEAKAATATGVILDYIKKPGADWTEETVPFPVKAAIILALRSLYDDETSDPISDTVVRLLARQRDPALA